MCGYIYFYANVTIKRNADSTKNYAFREHGCSFRETKPNNRPRVTTYGINAITAPFYNNVKKSAPN